MNLTTARGYVRQFARNAGDSTAYPEDAIDRAIQFVGNHFVRATRRPVRLDSILLTPGDPSFDVSTLPRFRPDRLMAVHVLGVARPVERVDWETLYAFQIRHTAPGAPQMIAFNDWETVNVFPTPDLAYPLQLRWVPPFTTWTPGIDTPDTITLSLPDDWLAEILVYGPPAILQHNEPEHAYAGTTWKKYLELVESLAGAGDLAARVVSRSRAGGVGRVGVCRFDVGGFPIL